MRLMPLLLALTSTAFADHPPDQGGHAAHPAPPPPAEARASAAPGYLVLAPDRGFMGNQETLAIFDRFAQAHDARLVIVTDARTEARIASAVGVLAAAGASEIVALPFFLSEDDPDLALVREQLGRVTRAPVRWSRAYGDSYLAVEALAARLRAVEAPARTRVIVAGYGATDEASRRALEEDLQRLADAAARGLGLKAVRALVFYDTQAADQDARRRELAAAFADEAGLLGRVAVVPFELGPKLDSMMSFSGYLGDHLTPRMALLAGDAAEPEAVGAWLEREATRAAPLAREDLGVVVLAHGADHEWNEAMRQAVAPLEARYKVEYAFSMADQPVIEGAIRRLEARGARAIVIVRVFGLAASFRSSIDRMVGLDVEQAVGLHGAGHHGGGHALGGHDPGSHGHGHGGGAPGPRIHTRALVTSVGGVEDDPLFAEALLDRARALSKDPGKETVILVAHGYGDDRLNAHWRGVLDSLAVRMREGGSSFRAIHVGTWREDWDDKRPAEVEAIRGLVQGATADGGRALVIPARTTGTGPEKRLLEGLTFELGSGFAPSPQFTAWMERQVEEGARALGVDSVTTAAPVSPHDHAGH